MSFEEELEKRAAQQPEIISVTELPEEITAKIQSYIFKADKRGNEALFLRLQTPEGKIVIQKYTPSTYKHLKEAIEKCGGYEYLKQNYTRWVKMRAGRAINERLFPVKEVKRK